MTDSNSTGALGAVQDIDTFAARFGREGWPEIGETFARKGRVFEVVDCGRISGVPLLVVASTCVTCDAPFEAVVNWHPMGLPVGSCTEHRRTPQNVGEAKPKEPKPPRKRKAKKRKGPRIGVYERVVLDVVDELSLVYSDINLDMLLKRAKNLIEPPPEGERDTRRQCCLRAVYSAAQKKGWDVAGGVLYVTEEQST